MRTTGIYIFKLESDSYRTLIERVKELCTKLEEGTLIGVGLFGSAKIVYFRTPFLYLVGWERVPTGKDRVFGRLNPALAPPESSPKDLFWFDYYEPSYPGNPIDRDSLKEAFFGLETNQKGKTLSAAASIVHSFISGAVRFEELKDRYLELLEGRHDTVDLSVWGDLNRSYHALAKRSKLADSFLRINKSFRSLTRADLQDLNEKDD